jgi:heme exporter protein D
MTNLEFWEQYGGYVWGVILLAYVVIGSLLLYHVIQSIRLGKEISKIRAQRLEVEERIRLNSSLDRHTNRW